MPYIHGKSIIKIAVADDHEMFREAISAIVDGFDNCKVVIQAANGRELLEKLQLKSNTDLVLLDIAMPEMDGYETAKNLCIKFPEAKILFCSMFKNELAICRMISAGGNGFINKEASTSELKKALFEIMKNGYCFPNSDGRMSFYNEKNSSKRPLKNQHQLTIKELQFLKLVCTEKPYKQIAADLDMSDRQVDYLRERLFSIFDVHSRIGMAVHACQSGMYASASA
jgi:DNA-binding NarL/FixJ family response regulator